MSTFYQYPFLHSGATYLRSGGSPILHRWWFTQSVERSISAFSVCNSHRKPTLRLLKRHDSTRHDDDVSVFSRCFPGVPPVNLNPQIVYNHMNAVIMCSGWDPDPPNILESDNVTFFKVEAVWLCHSRGWRLFREKFTEVTVWRAGGRGGFFQHKHLASFLLVKDTVF